MFKKIITSIVLLLFSLQAYAVNPDDLLRPEQAFKPSISAESGGVQESIRITWNIADAYYMYKKRFSFVSETAGINLGEPIIPKGKIKDDPGFGTVETYRNQVQIDIPFTRDSGAHDVTKLSVKTTSQGCADAGICYPPQKKTLAVSINTISAAVKQEPSGLMEELGLSNLVNTNAPLPPSEAFKVKLDTAEGQLIKANWDITKGHYLYQDKIKLKIVEPKKGLSISDLDLPPAVKEIDPFFGEMNTYNKDFTVSVKVDGDPELLAKDILVKATYQGCSKLTGICYPPQHDTLKLKFSTGQLINVASQSYNEDISPQMDPNPVGQQQSSLMAELSGSNALVSSSPVSSSTLIEKSDLASQLGIENLVMDNSPLDPDQAFVLDITAKDRNALQARWNIVDGHYLYQHKFAFELVDAPADVRLGKAELPPGKAEHDQYFGDIVTYNKTFSASVPLLGTNNIDAVTVKTHYQGCSKITGICYPPQHKKQTVNLPKGDIANAVSPNINTSDTTKALANTATTATTKVSEQQSFVNRMKKDNFWVVLSGFFLAGLALTFTPCVFPMIPILSGIIAGQGSETSTRKSFFLSLSYVLVMALTYAIVGVFAAMSGENLQVALQNPWVIGGFAILFVLLSLSMFGFYELQMPSSVQSKLTNISNSQEGGNIISAGIMGFLSALIVGPCVTAPLIGALIYIAQTKDILLGGLSLFALGLGMGVPLLIIGTSAGKILPRAGAWMDKVKAGFGIMMLTLAIWMLERILPFNVIVILSGILAVFTGIYMGALDTLNDASTGWRRFFKAAGLVVLLYGAALLIGAASGKASLLKPLHGFTGGGSAAVENHLSFKKIKGIAGLEDALALAKQKNQAVMLDFYADWCISCKEMEHNTFTDAKVIDSLNNTLVIQADVTLDDEKDKALNSRFGLFGPPAILFFDKNGQENTAYRIVGYKGPADFHQHVEEFKQTLR